MTDEDLLDEAYERLQATGPEFDGWLSNHGPMAADALLRLGHGGQLAGWLDGYVRRLHEPPQARWRLDPDEWREVLGDPSRLGDWRALFADEVRQDRWQAVLARWWPRLLPGAAASAAHGLIRTGHAVRALRERESEPRLRELAEALAYWAARWQPLPAPLRSRRALPPTQALEALPAVPPRGGFRTRLAAVTASPDWPRAVGALHRVCDPVAVPAALDALVDAAVGRYLVWGHASPVMLVHAATAPRAAGLVLPSLPSELWPDTYRAAWAVTAAVASAYRPVRSAPQVPPPPPSASSMQDAAERAVRLGDEHAIKFVETALDAHRRGNVDAAAAGNRAVDLIPDDA